MSVALTYGQPVTLSSTFRYQTSGDNTDRYKAFADYDGTGFVATGYSVKKGNYKDVLTARLTSSGDTIWWRTKNGAGNGNDDGAAVAVDFFGNVYVAGTTDNGNTQD
ncbi:MAG: SBBP repeat-containing protein, partial [Bacteroidota bacterium]